MIGYVSSSCGSASNVSLPLTHTPGGRDDGSGAWVFTICMEDSEWIASFWLERDPTLAVWAIQGLDHLMNEPVSVSVSPLSNKWINHVQQVLCILSFIVEVLMNNNCFSFNRWSKQIDNHIQIMCKTCHRKAEWGGLIFEGRIFNILTSVLLLIFNSFKHWLLNLLWYLPKRVYFLMFHFIIQN